MAEDVRRSILDGACTAFVNGAYGSNLAYRPEFVSNDRSHGNKVLSVIEAELLACDEFMFSVAFITSGGIEPLKLTLAELKAKHVHGRILTTDYELFNDPKALVWLNEQPNIEVRMFETGEVTGEKREGFHTKGYLFHRPDGTTHALIGSSNLTGNALTSNHEWNAKVVSAGSGELLQAIENEFEDLWDDADPLDGIIDTYSRIYRSKQEALAETFKQAKVASFEQVRLQPNMMQTEFVKNLRLLEQAGENKALLISATGTGKTYASAFALRDANPRRALFLAHREQILKQAMGSYRNVFGTTKSLGLLSGTSHDSDADILFATMQTMRKDEVLHRFPRDAFDIIVIDEVHHAGAPSYQKIINYFDARLYLGMTGTPDRTDSFDIYKLFDHNIACEIRLQQALEDDLVCPFHYFGITDIAFEGTEGEDEIKDFSKLIEDKRVDYILEQANYYGYSGDRVKGLVFCSRIDEAQSLSAAFNKRGYRTIALSGSDSQEARLDAVERLSADPGSPHYDDRLDYIFSVDIFNEGVDVPQVNQVLLLRPTESPIVFVQQLGRGLRKADGKEFVVILDFIGNYANNYMIPIALSGDRSYNKDSIRKYVLEGNRVIPGYSTIHFDKISRERIFKSIDSASTPLKLLKEKYLLAKQKLGHIPTMVDFLEHGEIDPLLFIKAKGSYPAFLQVADRDYKQTFSHDQALMLEYLSKFVANGMRPHELLMLQMLLDHNGFDVRSFEERYYELYDAKPRTKDCRSAIGVLDFTFVNSASDKKKYGSLELVHTDDQHRFMSSVSFEQMLKNDAFRDAVQDIISFGLERFDEKYREGNGGLTLYEKYSRKDVCRLLDWEKDNSSTIFGYRIEYGTCPIFVTYHKADDISSSTRYDDVFVDQQTFSWMTKNSRTLQSPEVQKIANARTDGCKVYLFIKKDDNEGSDFYYMGEVNPETPTEKTILDDKGAELPIVNFQLKLEHPVREDYYDYFVSAAAQE